MWCDSMKEPDFICLNALSFNSNVVRFNAEKAKRKIEARALFQFQCGAIQCKPDTLFINFEVSFNSNVVRFNVGAKEFQTWNEAVSIPMWCDSMLIVVSFIRLYLLCFNSNVVRFNVLIKMFINDKRSGFNSNVVRFNEELADIILVCLASFNSNVVRFNACESR